MSDLAKYIARELLAAGDPVDKKSEWKCRRIEFRLSRKQSDTREQERDGGGFGEHALAQWISDLIEKYAIEKGGNQ